MFQYVSWVIQLDPGRSCWVHSPALQLRSAFGRDLGCAGRGRGFREGSQEAGAHGAQRGRASTLMGNWWNLHGSGGEIWKKPMVSMVSMFNFDFWGLPIILPFNQVWEIFTNKPWGKFLAFDPKKCGDFDQRKGARTGGHCQNRMGDLIGNHHMQ